MALDFSTTRTRFTDLAAHVGHDIECVAYGDVLDPVNVSIECLTCGCVLLDVDADDE